MTAKGSGNENGGGRRGGGTLKGPQGMRNANEGGDKNWQMLRPGKRRKQDGRRGTETESGGSPSRRRGERLMIAEKDLETDDHGRTPEHDLAQRTREQS